MIDMFYLNNYESEITNKYLVTHIISY